MIVDVIKILIVDLKILATFSSKTMNDRLEWGLGTFQDSVLTLTLEGGCGKSTGDDVGPSTIIQGDSPSLLKVQDH